MVVMKAVELHFIVYSLRVFLDRRAVVCDEKKTIDGSVPFLYTSNHHRFHKNIRNVKV